MTPRINLFTMVKMRASQINGCAYCLDMHSKEARADGETEQRLYGLAAREHFSEEELVNLTLAITTINAWNRLCVAFRPVPGTYERRVASVSVSSSRA